VVKNVPIYDLAEDLPAPQFLCQLQDEWNHVLLNGPGVLVVKNLYRNAQLLDHVSTIYDSIITKERATSSAAGDHFASAGHNSRIWNSFSKHCLADPKSFCEYYSNPWLAAICEAWLGPGYRITAQVNIVHPGGAAQSSHRDYHLGFQTRDGAQRYPKAVQIASQLLTLQGAVAHTDMPVESGPTRLLPFSQMLEDGYMAFRESEFQQFFLENHVSLPLEKGDGLFFNPALFHAAGENQTKDFSRSANLLQISSAFGKTMETIDTRPLIEKSWEHLVLLYEKEGLSGAARALVAVVADGYPFPTNLDKSPPDPTTMAPLSEQQMLIRLLEKRSSKEDMLESLARLRSAREA
jgi:ectoine hydroxylase-related dioxygenase (phytanoyl-CoA dioxygenase family)